MMRPMGTASVRPERMDPPIGGMTCASCAGRVERRLSALRAAARR